MRRPLALGFLLVTVAWAGCLEPGDGNGGGVGPFAGACDTASAENRTALVGGIANPDGDPVAGVDVEATPQDGARDEVTNVSSEAGCYVLDLEPHVVYDVTWLRDGYAVERRDAVIVGENQTRIQHVYLRPL